MADFVTILRTHQKRNGSIRPATKTLSQRSDGTWLKTKLYIAGTVFHYTSVPVTDIYSLFDVIVEASNDPTAFIIRGGLKNGVDPSRPVNRRWYDRPGDPAHFEEVPRQWAMLDFDNVAANDNIDLIDDPESAVEGVIYDHLPGVYRDVSCVWQLSSGAGSTDPDGTLSAHLWFWLDRPWSNEELKLFHAAHAPSVDKTLFRTVQPHYIANPVFQKPFIDPLPRRIGLMQREFGVLTLPQIDLTAPIYQKAREGLTGNVRGFEAKLELLGDGPGLNGFNDVITPATAAYVCKRFPHEINYETIKRIIREAIDKAPIRITRDPADIARYKSDQYLDESIRTATTKFALRAGIPLYPAPSITPEGARVALNDNILDAIGVEIERLLA